VCGDLGKLRKLRRALVHCLAGNSGQEMVTRFRHEAREIFRELLGCFDASLHFAMLLCVVLSRLLWCLERCGKPSSDPQ
jgi:hypothetical protein